MAPQAEPLAAMWGGRAAQTERDVSVDEIVVGDRLRPVGEGAVADLMVSIREVGLIQPIVLRPVQGADGEIALHLVAGRHRLEAHCRLELEAIRARIVSMTDLDALQAEIDENLVRSEPGGWERCSFLGARAEVYAERHPEVVAAAGDDVRRGRGRPRKDLFSLREKNGVARHIPVLMGFLAEVSDKTGLARKTLLRDAQIWAALHPYDAEIRRSSLAHDTNALRQIAARPPEERPKVIEALTSGRATDVSSAVTVALGGTPVKAVPTPVDQSVKAFRKVWADASPSARAAILADLAGRSLPKGWVVEERADA